MDTELVTAARAGDSTRVTRLLSLGASPNAIDEEINSNPHVGPIDIMRFVQAHGANVEGVAFDLKPKEGWTALHYASINGHVDVVRALLANDADVDAREKNGQTALHCATSHGSIEVMRVLLEGNASIEAKDNEEETPLHKAARKGDAGIIRLLLEFDACTTALNKKDDDAPLTEIPDEVASAGPRYIQEYIKALLTSTKCIYRHKVCVVGPTTWGKTSLIKSVTSGRATLEQADTRTVGIDRFTLEFPTTAANGASEQHEVTFWDFAGQDVYHAAHAVFFSKRSVFLLVHLGLAYPADEEDMHANSSLIVPAYWKMRSKGSTCPERTSLIAHFVLSMKSSTQLHQYGWEYVFHGAYLPPTFFEYVVVCTYASNAKRVVTSRNEVVTVVPDETVVRIEFASTDHKKVLRVDAIAVTKELAERVVHWHCLVIEALLDDYRGLDPIRRINETGEELEEERLVELLEAIAVLVCGELELELAIPADTIGPFDATLVNMKLCSPVSTADNVARQLSCKLVEGQLFTMRRMLGMSTSWSCCYDGALPSTLKTWRCHQRKGFAYGGKCEVVRFLLDRGADIEAMDRNGSTALHSAAYGGMSKVVRLLVKNGADIEATDERDRAQSDALTEIPDEVFSRGAMAVKAYLAELSDSSSLVFRHKICPLKHEVTFWDFAGQDVYHAAHTVFFSKRTVFLMVVDLPAYAEKLAKPSERARATTSQLTWDSFAWLWTLEDIAINETLATESTLSREAVIHFDGVPAIPSLRRCALRCRAEKENGLVRQEIARGTWALTEAIPEASLGLFGPTDMRIDLLDAASTNQIIGHLTCRVSCSSAEKAASVP
ncbi:hypothetical protein ATCC90586_002138 [Pythium insidiosum]|nr:hypothetical protein ATCC90586_002138 [Pythium insidiosum]